MPFLPDGTVPVRIVHAHSAGAEHAGREGRPPRNAGWGGGSRRDRAAPAPADGLDWSQDRRLLRANLSDNSRVCRVTEHGTGTRSGLLGAVPSVGTFVGTLQAGELYQFASDRRQLPRGARSQCGRPAAPSAARGWTGPEGRQRAGAVRARTPPPLPKPILCGWAAGGFPERCVLPGGSPGSASRSRGPPGFAGLWRSEKRSLQGPPRTTMGSASRSEALPPVSGTAWFEPGSQHCPRVATCPSEPPWAWGTTCISTNTARALGGASCPFTVHVPGTGAHTSQVQRAASSTETAGGSGRTLERPRQQG